MSVVSKTQISGYLTTVNGFKKKDGLIPPKNLSNKIKTIVVTVI